MSTLVRHAMNRAERRGGFRRDRKLRRLLGAYSPVNAKAQFIAVPSMQRYARRHMNRWTSMATRRSRKERARVQRLIDRRWR